MSCNICERAGAKKRLKKENKKKEINPKEQEAPTGWHTPE